MARIPRDEVADNQRRLSRLNRNGYRRQKRDQKHAHAHLVDLSKSHSTGELSERGGV
jgi:hypothetical protein